MYLHFVLFCPRGISLPKKCLHRRWCDLPSECRIFYLVEKQPKTRTQTHTHIRTCWSLTAVWLALSRGWMESVKLWWMATERQRGGRGGIFWRKGVEEKVPIKWSLLYSTLSFLIALNRLWINSWMWSFVFGQTGRSWHEGGVGCVCASTAVWQSGSEMEQQV